MDEFKHLPSWLVFALVPVGITLFVARLSSSLRWTLASGGITCAVVATALAVSTTQSGPPPPKPDPPRPSRKTFDPWDVSLGAAPLGTVIYEGKAWTLTDDGRLVGTELASRVKLEPRRVSRDARGILLCGAYLVLLKGSGRATLRSAKNGRKIRSYPFGVGSADAASCSQSRLWIVTDDLLVRLDIPELGKGKVRTFTLKNPADVLLYWASTLWALDTKSGTMLGYDRDGNAIERSTISGASALLGIGEELLAVHRRSACLRHINPVSGYEMGSAAQLSRDPGVSASYRDGAAIGGYGGRELTLIANRRVETYILPTPGLEITGVAIDEPWIAVDDAGRVLFFKRRALDSLEPTSSRRLQSCI